MQINTFNQVFHLSFSAHTSFKEHLYALRFLQLSNHLVGLVVKVSASRVEDRGFESARNRIFPGQVIPVT